MIEWITQTITQMGFEPMSADLESAVLNRLTTGPETPTRQFKNSTFKSPI